MQKAAESKVRKGTLLEKRGTYRPSVQCETGPAQNNARLKEPPPRTEVKEQTKVLNNTTADMEGRSRTPQASPRAKLRDELYMLVGSSQTKEVSMLNPGAIQSLHSRRHTGVQGQQGAGADPW